MAKSLNITKYYYIFQDLLCDDSLELGIPDFTLITEMFTTSLARLKEAIGANSVKSPSFGTLPKVKKIIRDLRVPKVQKKVKTAHDIFKSKYFRYPFGHILDGKLRTYYISQMPFINCLCILTTFKLRRLHVFKLQLI